jgi:hypothetical protein
VPSFSKKDTGEGTPVKKELSGALANHAAAGKLRVSIDTFGDDYDDRGFHQKEAARLRKTIATHDKQINELTPADSHALVMNAMTRKRAQHAADLAHHESYTEMPLGPQKERGNTPGTGKATDPKAEPKATKKEHKTGSGGAANAKMDNSPRFVPKYKAEKEMY